MVEELAGAPPAPGALPTAGGAGGAAGAAAVARVWLSVSGVALVCLLRCSTSAAHRWIRMLGMNTEQEEAKFP